MEEVQEAECSQAEGMKRANEKLAASFIESLIVQEMK
jgi:hypothetical protein